MGIYPKIPNGIVALRVKDGKLGELCTAQCSTTHVEGSLQWYLKRDPHNPTRRVYMSNKGEATWDIPISSLPTVEEKEVWNRHPTFVSLQRSRDGWAWYTANTGRLLPSYRDIEVEEGEDPMPYLGDAGFHTYAQFPQIEADPAHDAIPPVEIPFVPQSMLEDDFQPDLPPPPARGPRHIQGDIRLPENVREEMALAKETYPELENAPVDNSRDPALGSLGDITPTQPVEAQSQSPTMEERTLVPQIGGGVHDIHQSGAGSSGEIHRNEASSSSTQPHVSLPATPFQREFTPEEGENATEVVDDTMDWFQQEEPIRRRPPRQLRSRTIGQVTWAPKYGYRNYDAGEGVLLEEIQELLLEKPQGSWYGPNTEWNDQVRHLLYVRSKTKPRRIDRCTRCRSGTRRSRCTRNCNCTSNYFVGRSRCGTTKGFICCIVTIPHQ